ncbi:MAG: hypothetical protein SGPRY_008816 [Prymnesium sp.]
MVMHVHSIAERSMKYLRFFRLCSIGSGARMRPYSQAVESAPKLTKPPHAGSWRALMLPTHPLRARRSRCLLGAEDDRIEGARDGGIAVRRASSLQIEI